MKESEVKNTPKQFRKTKVLSIRTTPNIIAWLKEKQISATKIFNLALKDLGYNDKIKK